MESGSRSRENSARSSTVIAPGAARPVAPPSAPTRMFAESTGTSCLEKTYFESSSHPRGSSAPSAPVVALRSIAVARRRQTLFGFGWVSSTTTPIVAPLRISGLVRRRLGSRSLTIYRSSRTGRTSMKISSRHASNPGPCRLGKTSRPRDWPRATASGRGARSAGRGRCTSCIRQSPQYERFVPLFCRRLRKFGELPRKTTGVGRCICCLGVPTGISGTVWHQPRALQPHGLRQGLL